MNHPKTYTLTRGEWRAINRALAGAALVIAVPGLDRAAGARLQRRNHVRKAQNILSASYKRAAKKTIDGGAEAGEVPSDANLPPAVPPEFVK
ncbi:hypothetical protein LCGC14_1692750 [marine sediment metagenome]|uniref:Uncharacterized protein n=1 Tax=marine sediment metagenome TaxID=412755 RepID=A0A0F9KKF0_9ZZZZ